MPMVMEAIDRMSAAEKLQTMDYLWSSFSTSHNSISPDWHAKELADTESRVAIGIEEPLDWRAARVFLKEIA